MVTSLQKHRGCMLSKVFLAVVVLCVIFFLIMIFSNSTSWVKDSISYLPFDKSAFKTEIRGDFINLKWFEDRSGGEPRVYFEITFLNRQKFDTEMPGFLQSLQNGRFEEFFILTSTNKLRKEIYLIPKKSPYIRFYINSFGQPTAEDLVAMLLKNIKIKYANSEDFFNSDNIRKLFEDLLKEKKEFLAGLQARFSISDEMLAQGTQFVPNEEWGLFEIKKINEQYLVSFNFKTSKYSSDNSRELMSKLSLDNIGSPDPEIIQKGYQFRYIESYNFNGGYDSGERKTISSSKIFSKSFLSDFKKEVQ